MEGVNSWWGNTRNQLWCGGYIDGRVKLGKGARSGAEGGTDRVGPAVKRGGRLEASRFVAGGNRRLAWFALAALV